jgi:hypothetical protein
LLLEEAEDPVGEGRELFYGKTLEKGGIWLKCKTDF